MSNPRLYNMRKMKFWMLTAIFACGAAIAFTSCAANEDNAGAQQPTNPAAPAELKQGIWTEFDTVLVASGKYTMEQLAQMPTVAMWIQGDKASFFTYTAEETSETVEGKISYNNTTGKGTITFPTIADNPLSDQTVDFRMTDDETMEFELNYEGQKTTASFVWLCENLDNWSSEIRDEDWKELMAYYETIDKDAGPDASIDWGDFAEPLVWEEGAAAPAMRRSSEDSPGWSVFSSLFKESDPLAGINDKLDELSDKIDQVLENQRIMIAKLNEINERLIFIANKLNQQEVLSIFNYRNSTYYNPLYQQNVAYFDDAYALYKQNKGKLSQENKNKLGEYAKAWVGDGKKYVDLTWQYMKYLTTVQQSKYGTGMDKIYDGLTYDKYPWEHMGIDDRKSYRAYDLIMISKSLFMIALYAQYCGLSDIEKEGLYKIYKDYMPAFLAFSEFKASDPKKLLVCQIQGAHFAMHKEIQEYKYYNGPGSDAPDPQTYGPNSIYMPRWHFRGKIKIDNPAELREKLIPRFKMNYILNYYGGSPWYDALIEGHQYSAGATCNDSPRNIKPKSALLLWNMDKGAKNGAEELILPLVFERWLNILNVATDNKTYDVYRIEFLEFGGHPKWDGYNGPELFYAAIVAWHY